MNRSESRPRVDVQIEGSPFGPPFGSAATSRAEQSSDHWAEQALDTVRHVLESEGAGDLDLEVTVSFVEPTRIGALKAEHLGGAGEATDVLAFPLDGLDGLDESPGPRLLGDIVICPAIVERHAIERGRSVADELGLVLAHGALHLLGYDHVHETDRSTMAAREVALTGSSHLS